MKHLLASSLLLVTFLSCQKEEIPDANLNVYPQTWQLAKMTGNFPVFVKTGSDLPFQETYVFQADSTFTRTRQQGGQVIEVSGTFSARSYTDGPHLTLTYPADNNLINNCTAEPKETLIFQAENKTLTSSSQPCDGPLLEYTMSNR
ncbi:MULTISPECIES: hypothetical protein [Hymenobacter]|uniref:Lipocalin-like domain-containing protein n=1 Tax=Hymenobacter mucosus TaxID=1411120 RepID=A0A238V362_9BACT|nr:MULTISPECIES: hypothetical protein [Hymenobacter]SNR28706.1 hypothetical protein SAMN06269173_10137 [Hymenobacter mucosus]